MAFGHSSGINAEESIFNEVHRDQTNITYNIYITPGSDPEKALPLLCSLDAGVHLPTPSPESSSEGTVLLPTHHGSTTNSAGDIASRLIVSIVQSLMVSDASDQFRDLKRDLNRLQQTLALADLAIQAYECAPIGRSLASAVGKVVEQCLRVLRELLNAIDAYQLGLRLTPINMLWSRVWRSGNELDQLATIRGKLSVCRIELGECLQILDS
jgi:hypothetical protein